MLNTAEKQYSKWKTRSPFILFAWQRGELFFALLDKVTEAPSSQLQVSQLALLVKNLPASAGDVKRHGFDPWVRKFPWRRAWQPTPLFLPWKILWKRKEAGGL